MAKSNATAEVPYGIARALAVLVLVLALAGPVQVWAATCTRSLTFSSTDLRFSRTEGYDLVALSGARWLNRPGKPQLPLVPVRMALPAGCQVTGFRLAASDSTELVGDFIVWPSQPPQSLSTDRPAEFVEPSASVYTSSEPYPPSAGEMVGLGRLGGAAVCEVLVYPLRYIPAEHKLVFYQGLTIEIDYCWEAPLSGREDSGRHSDLLSSLVGDFQGSWQMSQGKMHEGSIVALGDQAVAYLIITCDSLSSYFEPLRDWKTRKGVPAQIVTVETIGVSYAGGDLQEKIRNCIKDYHSKFETDWVLLGGDTQVVPDRKAYVPLSDKPYLPCDLYYSDLDGTWNADGDLYWGEVPSDVVDLYADVFVGRAPVSNRGDVETFVDKVLTYEGFYPVPEDYQLDALFVGEVLWGDPEDPSDPDYTDAGVAKDLIESRYVPSRFSVQKLYESQGNLTHALVMSQLNQGSNIINILSHGQYKSMSLGEDVLTNDDVRSLLNGPRYGLLYGVTCLSGGFDQNDCIGEVWVTSRTGGGFFIGNSRYGWNSPSFPGDGPSDYYDQSFFESVFITGFTNLGKAHADAKHEFVGESRSDVYMRYVMYGLNLLGDPEMRLWTDQPAHLEVAFAPTLHTGPQIYTAEVTSGGSPLGGARVCLYKPGDVYCLEDTDGSGKASAFIDPGSLGVLYVTVTKEDCLPFAGQATVTDDSPPGAPRSLAARQEGGPCVSLSWEAVTDGDLLCYRLYRNTVAVPESLVRVPPQDTTYSDTDVEEGLTYHYWVSCLDSSGNESALSEPCSLLVVDDTGVPIQPEDRPAIAVRPNPFDGVVRFAVYGRPCTNPVVDIYDVGGRWVCEVHLDPDGGDGWGGHWEAREESGRRLPSGIYLARFDINGEVTTRKVVLLR